MKLLNINVLIFVVVCKNGFGCKIVLIVEMFRDYYSFNFFVCGYYVYKDEWIFIVGESLNCV